MRIIFNIILIVLMPFIGHSIRIEVTALSSVINVDSTDTNIQNLGFSTVSDNVVNIFYRISKITLNDTLTLNAIVSPSQSANCYIVGCENNCVLIVSSFGGYDIDQNDLGSSFSLKIEVPII